MNKSDIQKTVLISGSFVLFLFFSIGATWIVPENCYLFDNRIQGFLCDGIDIENPKPCPVCKDERTVSAAQIIFCLGFGFLFLPFVVYGIRDWQNRSANQTRLSINLTGSGDE